MVLFQIKRRKKDAGEPAKYMGCGDCDNFSRSITVSWYHISFMSNMMIVLFSIWLLSAVFFSMLINIDAIGAYRY